MGAEQKSRWQRIVTSPRMWLGLVIAVLVVAFILQNPQPARIELLTFQFTSPLWATLLAVFMAGLATGLLWARRQR